MAVTNFDIQTMLHDMRQEQREDIRTLTEKVEAGFQRQTEWSTSHELADQKAFGELHARIGSVERVGSAAKWTLRTVVGAVLVYLVSLLRYVPAVLR